MTNCRHTRGTSLRWRVSFASTRRPNQHEDGWTLGCRRRNLRGSRALILLGVVSSSISAYISLSLPPRVISACQPEFTVSYSNVFLPPTWLKRIARLTLTARKRLNGGFVNLSSSSSSLRDFSNGLRQYWLNLSLWLLDESLSILCAQCILLPEYSYRGDSTRWKLEFPTLTNHCACTVPRDIVRDVIP